MRWVAVVLAVGCAAPLPPVPQLDPRAAPPDLADRDPVVETLHGVDVHDPYRRLEDATDPGTASWLAQRNATYAAATDDLPQRAWLDARFKALWRYDDRTPWTPCLDGDRATARSKSADQDKWIWHLQVDGEDRVVLDPNTWDRTDTLAFFAPSPDCRLAAYGVARAGDENPVLHLLDLDTLEVLPDTFRGQKHGGVSWRRDGSGLYYAARPLPDEVPDGEAFYWHRTWSHAVGTGADQDVLAAHDPDVKETYNHARVTEEGRYLVVSRSTFNANALWLVDLEGDPTPRVIDDSLEHELGADVFGDRVFLMTDLDAPRYRVMVAAVDAPGRDGWTELVAEHPTDVLRGASVIGGRLYLEYLHDASTRLEARELDGTLIGDVPLPGLGTASVDGWATKPEVRVAWSSFAHPGGTYTWAPGDAALALLKPSAIPVDPALLDEIEVSQRWTTSKDGTQVPMFLVSRGALPTDGSTPTLLTGYGGFNISRTPSFGTATLAWVEAGGAVAIPNLRGGGEYGVAWHEAGMRERKQNVFDDFLGAAAFLEAEGVADPAHLAIAGGSNGGLLVAAAVTQAPERFAAVLCRVPLTDMIRFHTFGLANIWTEEYGSADDPEMFPHLLAYSPYHAVVKGTDYPAVLVTGSANDARTDPAHARKFAAALRWADADYGTDEPILLAELEDSGHRGGVGIDVRADQQARQYGFLMAAVGLTP